jgi:hypothetical protein
VIYTPAANYNGADSFTYTLSDGNGGASPAAVAIRPSGEPASAVRWGCRYKRRERRL